MGYNINRAMLSWNICKMNNQSKLLVKMYYKHYDNGEILHGRFAEQIDDNNFRITKQDKTTINVKIGENIPKAGVVSMDHNRNLKIGSITILVGSDHFTNIYAHETTSKTKFKIHFEDGRCQDVKIDEQIEGLGKLEMDSHSRIHINNHYIPIFKKMYEMNLLCMPTDKLGGKTAYFNMLMPKDPENRTNGIPGVFMPGKNGMPSTFQEIGPDGNLYATAQINPNPDGRSVTVKIRTLQNAVEDRHMRQELDRIKIEEADRYGENPMDIQNYVELRNKIIDMRTTSFKVLEFSVTKGHRLLGLKMKKEPESSMQPS